MRKLHVEFLPVRREQTIQLPAGSMILSVAGSQARFCNHANLYYIPSARDSEPGPPNQPVEVYMYDIGDDVTISLNECAYLGVVNMHGIDYNVFIRVPVGSDVNIYKKIFG
jgi:hypothetical protein